MDPPMSTDSMTSRVRAHNYLMVGGKVLALGLTATTFLLGVIPTKRTATSNVWCAATPEDGCFRFILYPIILSSIVLLLLAISLVCWFVDAYSNQILAASDCAISFVISLCWFGASVYVHSNKRHMQRFDEDSGHLLPEDMPGPWTATIALAALLGIIHFCDAALTCSYIAYRRGYFSPTQQLAFEMEAPIPAPMPTNPTPITDQFNAE